MRDQPADQLLGLDAIDQVLRLGVEILDAERQARESALPQGLEVRGRGHARIRFDRSLEAGGGPRQAGADAVHQLGKQFRRRKRRRAAA